MRSDPPGGIPEQPDELARLPHGRHGLPPEFVARNQRQRLIEALIQAVAADGYSGLTIARVVEGAGVTNRTYYKYFQTVEDCYLAALDQTIEQLAPILVEAYGSETEWPAQVRTAITVLLEFFAAEPELARLCAIEPFVAGPEVVRRYQGAVEALLPYFSRGRELHKGGAEFPESTERGLIGSINSRIARMVSGGEAAELPALAPELVQFALTPYLGPAAARQVALGS